MVIIMNFLVHICFGKVTRTCPEVFKLVRVNMLYDYFDPDYIISLTLLISVGQHEPREGKYWFIDLN